MSLLATRQIAVTQRRAPLVNAQLYADFVLGGVVRGILESRRAAKPHKR